VHQDYGDEGNQHTLGRPFNEQLGQFVGSARQAKLDIRVT